MTPQGASRSSSVTARTVVVGEIKAQKGAAGAVAMVSESVMAFGSSGGTVGAIDVEGGETMWLSAAHEPVFQSIVHDPETHRLASGSGDGWVLLWDARTGRNLGRLSHPAGVNEIALSSVGRRVAVACDDNRLYLWGADDSVLLRTIDAHDAWVVGVGWSPDGTRVVTSSNDETMRLWDPDAESESAVAEFDATPMTVSWDHGSNRIAAGMSDGSIVVVEGDNLEEISRFQAHESEINTVEWSPDGELLASGSDDGTVRIGSETAEAHRISIGQPYVWRLSWGSPSRLAVSAANDTFIIIDLSTPD